MVASERKAAVSSLLFESFADVPDAWHAVCESSDLAMDPKVLRVFQHTLADQCRCWGVIVFGESGEAIGCAALCLFPTELIETGNPAIIRLRDKLRRFWPGFARLKVLFCGLPIPSGSTHLRVKPGASEQSVIEEVDKVMCRLAGKVGGRLTVFKELDDESGPFASTLLKLGYAQGEIPPMHLLEVSFASFADYRNALKSRYRAQVQRSQKKLVTAGFEIVQGRGGEFFAAHFDEHVYRLYVEVQRRAEQKLELLPRSFFLELARELGDEALLTLIRREGRICAFTFSVTRGGTHYNMYSGVDYELNNDGDLYFNLFYSDMDQAFCAGITSQHLGQTSDMFKSRLGTATQKLWFFARLRPASFNGVLRLFAPIAFPKVATVEPNDVFTEPQRPELKAAS